MLISNEPVVILESDATLADLERSLRGHPTHPRVQLLPSFKTGQARTLLEAAPLVGYSIRRVNRWWHSYRQGGLETLLQVRPRPGNRARLTEEAGGCGSNHGPRQDRPTPNAICAPTGRSTIAVCMDSGISWTSTGVRLKAGRHRHRQADPTAQESYKRDLRPPARASGPYAGPGV